jgi:hypothetical protein
MTLSITTLQQLKCDTHSYAECRYAQCQLCCGSPLVQHAERHFAECYCFEFRHAESHYAKCRYAECRGVQLTSSLS